MPPEEVVVTEIFRNDWQAFVSHAVQAARQGREVVHFERISDSKMVMEFSKSATYYGKYAIEFLGNRVSIVAQDVQRLGTGYSVSIAAWMARVMQVGRAAAPSFIRLSSLASFFFVVVPLPVLQEGMKGLGHIPGGSLPDA